MRTRTHTIAVLALSCAAGPLSAQETSQPPRELGQLSFFVGDWQCTGQILARGSHPGHATAAVGHASRAVDGRWIQFAYEERKTGANPTPYRIAGYMGYDAGKKKFVQTIVDNSGYYGPSFSDGWRGDTLTFEGSSDADGGKSRLVRDHFVRKQHAFVHFSEGQTPDGKWFKPDQETCKLATR